MNPQKHFRAKQKRRIHRVRAKIFGTAVRPRLAVFRSSRFIYAQLIDDEKGHTMASASSRGLKLGKGKSGMQEARAVGEALAEKAKTLHIARAVFDRRSYSYHGRVQSLCEGAREKGLKI